MNARDKNHTPLLLSGDLFLKDSQNDEAIACYIKATTLEDIKTWEKDVLLRFYNNLGVAYKRKGNFLQAQRLFEQGILTEPLYSFFYFNLYTIYKDQNRMESAEKLLLKAISLRINDIRCYVALIELYQEKRYLKKALEVAIICANQFKEEYKSHLLVGNCFTALKLYKNAIEPYLNAIKINPKMTSSYNNIGVAYKELEEYDNAKAMYEKVLALNPNDPAVHNNLGNLLRNLEDFKGAVSHLEASIKINPTYADAYSNLGAVYKEQKMYDKAEGYYRKALELSPNHTNANFDLALIELTKGNYQNGWRRYEHRIKMDELVAKIHFYTTPMWRGESLDGKTIILQNEQGFGDNIMFIRYVPMFVKLGVKVIVRTRLELVDLFRSIEGVDSVISEEDAIPPHDYYLPLLSAPSRFATTLETIPSTFPYLVPNKQKIGIKLSKDALNIGLVWSSSRTNKDFKNKYIGLEYFKDLFTIKGTKWYSLQVGDDSTEIKSEKLEAKITDLSKYLVDFSATANMIANLDIVITTDTSVAHLCGAMNKEAWVLVPNPSDWRWMQEGNSTPWYKSLKLFRQNKTGSWESVISEIKKSLQER
ncbi:MAG: tetratricopeptide repeat protein [Sulfuricurvum sp.]